MEFSVKYSIVIPVYNSTRSLEEMVARIDSVFTNQVKSSYEIIFIDDASPNKETWAVIKSLVENKKNIKGVQLMRNFGKQGAMLCGFEEASGEYIITMDDDLQHQPEDIPSLIEMKDHDVVIALFSQKHHSLFKKFLSVCNNWFETLLINKPLNIKNSPFKLLKSEVVKEILKIKTSNPSVSALIFFTTRDVVMAHATHGKRAYDSSGFTFLKMYKLFSNLIFNNSSFLLRVIAINGVLIAALSLILAIYYFYKKIFIGIPITGWASMMTVILFLGGMILFSVGIVGEYLIRIINGIERKPPFIIRKKI